MADSSSGAGNRLMTMQVRDGNGTFKIEFNNDNNSSGTAWLQATRSNNTASNITLTGSVINLTGSTSATITGTNVIIAGILRPNNDNARTLGTASQRWSTVFAGTGTINTSDENQKEQIATLDVTELQVALAIKGLIKKFKFKDAVLAKGSAARIHVGVIAQEVAAAFTAHGLDANDYGMFCEDVWYELDGVTSPTYFSGSQQITRKGIRYEELLAFVISAL
jgi:hypothetical protein